MKTIPSFEKDHRSLQPGFYLSMTDKDVLTYDLRFVKPNSGKYMSVASMHTIEHLLATVLRNGARKESVIYFGPMGCRTGFYLLMRNMELAEVKTLLTEAIEQSMTFEEVPGSSESECGNYKEHDISAAKTHLKRYLKLLKM